MYNTSAEEMAYDKSVSLTTETIPTAPSTIQPKNMVSSLTSVAFTATPSTTTTPPTTPPTTTSAPVSNNYVVYNPPSFTPSTTPTSSPTQVVEPFAQEPIYKPADFVASSTLISGNDTGVNTKQVLDAIKAKAQTDFDKDKFYLEKFDKNALENSFNGELSTKEKAMSSLIDERNREELKNTCIRNKDYSKYHYEDMRILSKSEYSLVPSK